MSADGVEVPAEWGAIFCKQTGRHEWAIVPISFSPGYSVELTLDEGLRRCTLCGRCEAGPGLQLQSVDQRFEERARGVHEHVELTLIARPPLTLTRSYADS